MHKTSSTVVRLVGVIALFPFMFAVVGCGNKLTRDKATKLIIQKMPSPKPVMGYWLGVGSFPEQLSPGLRALESKGLLSTIHDNPEYTMFPHFNSRLTPQGERVDGNYLTGKVYDKVFDKVTGIEYDKGQANVEFSCKYNLTDLGRMTGTCQLRLPDGMRSLTFNDRPGSAIATFKLYDDGWRLVRIASTIGQEEIEWGPGW